MQNRRGDRLLAEAELVDEKADRQHMRGFETTLGLASVEAMRLEHCGYGDLYQRRVHAELMWLLSVRDGQQFGACWNCCQDGPQCV